MSRSAARRGYTLVETIVGLMVFSVGGLALASTAALIGRQLKFDDLRERAARVAVSRLEVLRASCLQATSGSELVQGVRSMWSVTTDSSGRAGLIVSVTYASSNGARSDAYRSIAQCR